ncbi:MAG: hypothetical protein JW712_10375 [Dehalococcoidales bacterium]|nr:hypothetical protein [Dehalococcoidales bacterium]
MPGEFYVEGKQEKLNIQVMLDLLLKLERSSQSGWKLMAGTYQPVYEESQAAAYLFCGGKVDLSPMEAGDVIDIRIQTKLEATDTYKTIWHETYNGVQPEDWEVVKVPAMPDNFGLEVSMRQTTGPLKFILCEFFDAKQ